jgi:REP element-mobilizing transposase RayT
MQRRDSAPQLDFGFRTPRRPRRPKRGRPRKAGAGTPHTRRVVDPRLPLHVTLRMHRHVWQLRSRRCFGVLERAFYLGCDRFGGRLCQFSVQHNHIHLVVEASDAAALARALQGLCIRMAKGLNRLMERKGAVFADRYHARSLRTPTEVRRALVYVLGNGRKHLPQVGHRLPAGWLDPYSSAVWFDGWSIQMVMPLGPGPVARPKTWLLATGYRRAGGPLRPDESPVHSEHGR